MKTKDIVNISLFATLLSVCAWICIPTVVPFTMQTFAVFLAMLVLGGRKGTIVICIYLFLGVIGIPVFSRGTAGIGVLLGNTGGYMIGWIFLGLFVCAADRLSVQKSREVKKWLQIMAMFLGLFSCYLFGTWWFMHVYAAKVEPIGFPAAIGMCVMPFVVPDLIKLGLAWIVGKRIRKIVNS